MSRSRSSDNSDNISDIASIADHTSAITENQQPALGKAGRKKRWNLEEVVRAFLACGAVVIAILSLTFYAFTRDSVLLTSGISSIGLSIVFSYYFSRKKEE